MGLGARLCDLRDRPGLGPTRAGPAGFGRRRPQPGRARHRAGRRFLLLLLRGGRDRQVALSEGRLGGLGACLPVRLDEPRHRARHRDLGPAGLAVHACRVPRRARSDWSDDVASAPVRLQAAGGGSPRPRPAGRRRSPAPLGRRVDLPARASDVGLRLVGRGAQLPQRLVDGLPRDHRRVLPRRVHRAASQQLLQQPVPHRCPRADCDCWRT